MPIDSTMTVLSVAEFFLWASLGMLFWRRKLRARFPAMNAYLVLRIVSMPYLLGALYVQSTPWGRGLFPAYYFGYFAVYIASAALLFFICMEVFRSALSAFPGLMRFGLVVFRWTVLVSVIVTISSIPFSHRGILIIPDIAFGLMRSVSILELCLLGFLCLSMNALNLPVRDVAFGISLGFGILSANDLIAGVLLTRNSTLLEPFQFVFEGMVIFALGIWMTYFALPEQARQPVVMPVNSTIYRWNEIASALGHPGTQVALPQPADSFFLTDVEKVVEKVLNKNLKGRESES